jgi:hypothetical protein
MFWSNPSIHNNSFMLTNNQEKALLHVEKGAKVLSEMEYPEVLEKLRKLGFVDNAEKVLKLIMEYISKDAPIIIHLREEIVHKLLNDNYYRNQFETGTSRGALNKDSRINWERRLFGDAYGDNDTNGFERVKYGMLTVTF